MSEFNPLPANFGDPVAGKWLYHGTAQPIADSHLKPFPGRTAEGLSGHFVFATSHYLSAACYAFKGSHGLLKKVGSDPTSPFPFAIARNREEFLKAARNGSVYRLRKKTFRKGPSEISQEWVSRQPVPVSRQNMITLAGLEDAMALGAQFYFLKPGCTMRALYESDVLYADELHKHPMLIWENGVRGIPAPQVT